MKILYTPNMICPAIPDADRTRILELAGQGDHDSDSPGGVPARRGQAAADPL